MYFNIFLWLAIAMPFVACLPLYVLPEDISDGLAKRDPMFVQTLAFEGRKGHEEGYVNDFPFFKNILLKPKPKAGLPMAKAQPSGPNEGGECLTCALHPEPPLSTPPILSSILPTTGSPPSSLSRSPSLLNLIPLPDSPLHAVSPPPPSSKLAPVPISPPDEKPFPLTPLLESRESRPHKNYFKRFWDWVKSTWKACYAGICKS